MQIIISEVPRAMLAEYGRIPISFEVRALFDVVPDQDTTFKLTERCVGATYLKDYDASRGEDPTSWEKRFDTSKWGFFIARADSQCVGGAAVAIDTPGLDMLEGRVDLAVLWDIRVLPSARRAGVGAALFSAAEAWALSKACRCLKIETQNINTGACRFYARQGCVLRAANHNVYRDSPDEIQLLWYKDLLELAV